MNEIISVDEFFDKIKGSTKKIIGIGALAFALSGCQAPPQQIETQNLTNGSEISQQIEKTDIQLAAAKLDTINETNYKEIINSEKSIIVQHPIYKDQITTIKFLQDENAETHIKNQLKELDLPESYYNSADRIDSFQKLATPKDRSHHIQTVFDDSGDINMSIINLMPLKPEYLITEYMDTLSEEEKELITPATQEELLVDQKRYEYDTFYLIQHEIGHSKKQQQLGFSGILAGVFNKDKFIILESDAESYAMISTAQMMHKNGESDEFILNYMSNKVRSAKQDHSDELHMFAPSISTVYNIMEQDLNYFLNMKPNEIDAFTWELSKNAMELDYSEDIKNQNIVSAANYFNQEKIKGLSSLEDSDFDGYSNRFKKSIDEKLENPLTNGTMKTNLENIKKGIDIIKENKNLSPIEIQMEILDAVEKNAVSNLKMAKWDVKINEVNNYSELLSKTMEGMEKRGFEPLNNNGLSQIKSTMKDYLKSAINDLDHNDREIVSNRIKPQNY